MPPDAGGAGITVAIATLDRPAALERCLKAVLAGNTQPGEVLVIDQSAGGETADVVARIVSKHRTPVHHVRQRRRGLAASRNCAIEAAAYPIVAFTDDDCVPAHDWLTQVDSAFRCVEAPDAVTGRVLPLGPDQPGLYAVSTRASAVRAVHRGRRLPWVVGSGGNTAVRREWLGRIAGFDERLGAGSAGRSAEDIDLLYRLLRHGAAVLYEPAAVIYHERQSGERRLASRPAYGFGMGAFCAFCARRGDTYALWMLSRWCIDRANALLRASVRLRFRRMREEMLLMQGASMGMLHGIRAGLKT
jgi:GT2 family glycosyltransferase